MSSLVFNAARRKFQHARSTLCVLQIFRHVHFNNVRLQNSICTAHSHNFPVHSHFVGVHNATRLLRRGITVDVRLRNSGGKERGQVSRSPSDVPGLSAAQKVKQASKDFTYFIVVLVGVGVTGGLLYILFKELLSSSSPNKIYGKTLDKCKRHPEVIGAFGEPIKAYGETSRRGRRQQISHVEFLRDGVKHMRLKFYIEGSEPRMQGTVHTELRENPETGKYEFRYVFVDMDTYPRRTIVVEDNR
ncbi:mitochondrial import inner membrane translocase subunit Tim21-like [Conger conger]|uniref:mitochondrial import inner membrane translocase subunit Tim21-like n=1 Tax=Conger conger TaxID=82655 RepID=UPI002A59F144|nr:mitochondrial import inner membrane translocase subunit Tim21-like [Conger conger]